jgi:hypothetical protein
VTTLVWRWRTCADPNRPTPAQCKALGIPPAPRIAHPLADRFGEPCTLIVQDGFWTIAPLYATRALKTSDRLPVDGEPAAA